MDKKKMLPYGVSNFEAVRQENYYYVDKTGYLRDLEEYKYVLFLRPRRFGKSLFLNMLRTYYDINCKDKFETLFGGLAIGEKPTERHNKYMMLSFNFSIVASLPSKVQDSFNEVVLEQIGHFVMRYGELLPAGTREYVTGGGVDCAVALSRIVSVVGNAGYKIYVTIDEYDNFANTLMSIDEASYQRILHADGFVRYFYNVLKAMTTENGAGVDRIFITGVSPLCLSDVTSGFNIAYNLSMESRFNGMVGFYTSEVREMLAYYAASITPVPKDTEGALTLMKSYYDNYCFCEEAAEAGEHLFNSDMTLYFISKYVDKKGAAPRNMLDDNVKQDFNKIRMMLRYEKKFGSKAHKMQSILNNGYTLAPINSQFQILELTSADNFISLLFYLGLLTYGRVNLRGREVVLPVVANEAMREQYGNYLSTSYGDALEWRADTDVMNDLWANWAYLGEWRPMIEYIASVMHDNDSVRDYGPEGEQFVKGFMLAHLCNGNGYIARTEAEMGHGYSDIYLYPTNPDYRHALVVEIKYLKPTATDGEVEAKVEEGKAQVGRYVEDKRLREEAEMRGWSLDAVVLVFRGWKVERVE